MMRIAGLYIYPIKSCRAASVDKSIVEPRGLQHDRRWIVVDDDGVFMTQRKTPDMALIDAVPTETGLRISFDGADSFDIERPSNNPETIDIFGKSTMGNRADDKTNQWFSDHLKKNCKLMYQGDAERLVDNAVTSYADDYPVLVTATASLADLNTRLDNPVDMGRFRPNIVIETDEPWIEDTWRQIKTHNIQLDLPSPCTRCIVITTDQQTGARVDNQPLSTLTKFRMLTGPDMRGAAFGQNAMIAKTGIVAVGDQIQVTDRQTAPVFKIR